MSCHLQIPLEFSDCAERPALSADAAAEVQAGPCIGDTDAALSLCRLRLWLQRLSVCALIAGNAAATSFIMNVCSGLFERTSRR